jgi:hypothetical protein
MSTTSSTSTSEGRIGGNNFLRLTLWIIRKRIQTMIRMHLSHILALFLGVLVVYRERRELGGMLSAEHKLGAEDWLILGVTGATLLATLWELWGNKMPTSPQEKRFPSGMKMLLFQLEKFAHGIDREPDVSKRLEKFIDQFLTITSETLCGNKKVSAGLMVPLADGKMLTLIKATERSNYPLKLEIPVPDVDGNPETGPAGIAYGQTTIVYVPYKRWKLGLPFRVRGDRYEPAGVTEGWITADPKLEQFRSVLCLPVAIYKRQGKKYPFAVLNYSTSALDPFMHRDFIMGECFSSILAQAFAIANAEGSGNVKREETATPRT